MPEATAAGTALLLDAAGGAVEEAGCCSAWVLPFFLRAKRPRKPFFNWFNASGAEMSYDCQQLIDIAGPPRQFPSLESSHVLVLMIAGALTNTRHIYESEKLLGLFRYMDSLMKSTGS